MGVIGNLHINKWVGEWGVFLLTGHRLVLPMAFVPLIQWCDVTQVTMQDIVQERR